MTFRVTYCAVLLSVGDMSVNGTQEFEFVEVCSIGFEVNACKIFWVERFVDCKSIGIDDESDFPRVYYYGG